MRIDVGELLKARTGETRSYQLDNWELQVGESAPHEIVNGVASLLRTRAGVLVRAHVVLQTKDSCSRCLRETATSLSLDFEEEFVPTFDIFSGAALPPPEDAGTFLIDAEQVLDLSEAVRQYRETTLPMQPLCRPDCAGLCPVCGQDLNVGTCRCPKEPADSRWSALAELGSRLEDN